MHARTVVLALLHIWLRYLGSVSIQSISNLCVNGRIIGSIRNWMNVAVRLTRVTLWWRSISFGWALKLVANFQNDGDGDDDDDDGDDDDELLIRNCEFTRLSAAMPSETTVCQSPCWWCCCCCCSSRNQMPMHINHKVSISARSPMYTRIHFSGYRIYRHMSILLTSSFLAGMSFLSSDIGDEKEIPPHPSWINDGKKRRILPFIYSFRQTGRWWCATCNAHYLFPFIPLRNETLIAFHFLRARFCWGVLSVGWAVNQHLVPNRLTGEIGNQPLV